MKIAYILDTYPSLTETFIAREIEALRRRGFEIEVFALHAGEGAHPIERVSHLKISHGLERLLTGRTPPTHFSNIGEALWREGSAGGHFEGVGHIHAGFASYPAFIAWGAASASGLPWSFSGHARDLFVDGAGLADKLHAAGFATVCTRAGQRLLQEQAPAMSHKVLYAPHGIEVERYSWREWKPGSPRLLSVGRLVEKKGFDDLLKVVSLLLAEGHEVRATVIGEGPLHHKLDQQARSLGVDGAVQFVGAQSHDAVRDAMAAANCFVLPCKIARDGDRDGLPNVLLEAAACGLPIVSTPVGGITDFLDETTGRLCPPADAAALAAAMARAFSEVDNTRSRCLAARRRIEQEYDIERNIDRMAAAFRSESIL